MKRILSAMALLGLAFVATADAQLVPFPQSGRILATINQRPETQGRIAFESLYRFLTKGNCPRPRVKLNPLSSCDRIWTCFSRVCPPNRTGAGKSKYRKSPP